MWRPLLWSAAAFVVSGCANVGVVSRPYLTASGSWESPGLRSESAAEFITYRLPVTVFDVTAVYEIRDCGAGGATRVELPDTAIALVSVTLEPYMRADPDPRYWYDVSAGDWSGFAVGLAEAKLELNEDRILTSVNYRSTPQFRETVSAFVRLAALSGTGGGTLAEGPFIAAPCNEATTNSLARRRGLRTFVGAMEAALIRSDTTITSNPTEAAIKERERIVGVRDAALRQIQDIRDNDLRFTIRYRWLPSTTDFERDFPRMTDNIEDLLPARFDVTGDNREQLRDLLRFTLQLRVEDQYRASAPAPAATPTPVPPAAPAAAPEPVVGPQPTPAGGNALRERVAAEAGADTTYSPVLSSCQMLDIGGRLSTTAIAPRFAASSVEADAQFTGVYHRSPVRVRPVLSRVGMCRELGWGATAPLNISVLQFGPLQRVPIEGSPFFARSRGATFTNGTLTSISAGANDAAGPASINAISDVADLERSLRMAEIERERLGYAAETGLATAREAYEETLED